MKSVNGILATAVLLACGSMALAQAEKPLQQRTISETIDTWITNAERNVVPLAEVMEYLKGSFAALHKAVATINQNNAVEQVKSPSSWQKTRLSFAIDAVAHCFDHYGQLVEYLRMNGIVPPASRPRKP